LHAKKKAAQMPNKPRIHVYSILEVDRVFPEDIRPTRGARLYILTPKMRIINKRWKNCNILTDYLVPLYLVDPEYYPNIQHTDSLQALTEHYPLGTSPYIIYLHEEFLLLRGIQEDNNNEGFLRFRQMNNMMTFISNGMSLLLWKSCLGS
jgi:hypothetical protein